MSIGSVAIQTIVAVLTQTTADTPYMRPLSLDQRLTPGDVGFNVSFVRIGSVFDSNDRYPRGQITVSLYYCLANPAADESEFMLAPINADLSILTSLTFWRDITGVHQIIREPEVTPPERIGNVIKCSVDVQLTSTS